ncbi:MAG: hypothetical protein A2W33_06695 [Chloroflexi bacterium RBG_16_52_11]|nr:MAG: hypothetical protein A2W33_06695 [Chloroflexi bacterium RBG_16_52_11]
MPRGIFHLYEEHAYLVLDWIERLLNRVFHVTQALEGNVPVGFAGTPRMYQHNIMQSLAHTDK